MRIWIHATEDKKILYLDQKCGFQVPWANISPRTKKRVTFSSLGTKVCILTRHFDHSVRNEIRLSSNSHRIQHEQTDVTSFWRTQVRRGMQTFFFRDGWKWTHNRANDLRVCHVRGTSTNCVINAATIFVNADHNDIFDISPVQQNKLRVHHKAAIKSLTSHSEKIIATFSHSFPLKNCRFCEIFAKFSQNFRKIFAKFSHSFHH